MRVYIFTFKDGRTAICINGDANSHILIEPGQIYRPSFNFIPSEVLHKRLDITYEEWKKEVFK